MRLLNIVLPAVFCATGLLADTLTVASWNIANLGAPGTELRGYDRTDEDYHRIGEIIAELDADVIAFQEIGSVAALQAVLGTWG